MQVMIRSEEDSHQSDEDDTHAERKPRVLRPTWTKEAGVASCPIAGMQTMRVTRGLTSSSRMA